MPYLTGLGILDAMVAGLPYIVTDQRATNPEIEYLVPGVTGLVTGDDPCLFADAVLDLFADKLRLEGMSEAASQESHQYSIENMADNFAHGIVSCLRGSA
jgi:glycosyltransferase involved in cell wall biosynthesis